MAIQKTVIPFEPHIRLVGEEVADELMERIEDCAKRHGKSVFDFSAKIELARFGDDELAGENSHYLVAEVVYHGGDLTKTG